MSETRTNQKESDNEAMSHTILTQTPAQSTFEFYIIITSV